MGEGTNPSSYSPLPLLAPSGMSGGKERRGRMGRGTYHIQGLPVGVGEGVPKEERKHDLGSEA